MNRMIRRLSFLAFIAAASLVVASAALAQPASHHKQLVQHVKLIVKSDDQHAKKGSDGKWHDAFLPASFKVKAGAKVIVTVVNYDDMPHSFNSKGLKTNAIIMPGTDKGVTTKFTFTAPAKAGKYAWHCDPKCDPWAMKHVGFMKGFVTVTA
jgi:plastocyanin